MQAKETRLQEIIEGTKQYVIPLFQRSYSWTEKEWEILWNDIFELAEMDNPRVHFMGSIVSMPSTSVPQGVAKYLLIDGQQRLTTIFVVLAVLRNLARKNGKDELADEIHNTLLVNQYKKDEEHYKLLPTQVDRRAYKGVIDDVESADNQITKAFLYFEKKSRNIPFELEKLLKIITESFSVVSIVLDADDNPYLVFESLNWKGRKLTQADLIKNYFFMRIHQSKQEEIYNEYWLPMQTCFSEDLFPEFIRHFMMRKGGMIRQTDVYYSLKEQVTVDNAVRYIQELSKYSRYYKNMISPEYESDSRLRECFMRLNRIEATTAYPILLYFYGEYDNQNISSDDFVEILSSLENYLIRRFICDYKTNQLNKIFSSAYSYIQTYDSGSVVDAFKSFLSERGYPKDSEFRSKFMEAKMYGAGERKVKTKFILDSLEQGYHHKERIELDNLTIEHVMPQTLSVWWQNYLGDDWENVHDELLDNIGNLTLTAYNSELSNDDYDIKRKIYSESHLELNKYFSIISEWKREQIVQRSSVLVDKAIEIWPCLNDDEAVGQNEMEVSKTTPYSVEILGETFKVKSWRDVFEVTMNTIIELEPEKFEQIADRFSKYIGKDKNKFRAIRQLSNGYYIEVNRSASTIFRNCLQVVNMVGLTSEDWIVNYVSTESNGESTYHIEESMLSSNKEKIGNNLKQKCVETISKHFGIELLKVSNSVYKSNDNSLGFYFAVSKAYIQSNYKRYWFSYRKKDEFSVCEKCYYVFGCQDESIIISMKQDELEEHLSEMNTSIDNESGEIVHWHVVFLVDDDKRVKWFLSKPEIHEIDITDRLVN